MDVIWNTAHVLPPSSLSSSGCSWHPKHYLIAAALLVFLSSLSFSLLQSISATPDGVDSSGVRCFCSNPLPHLYQIHTLAFAHRLAEAAATHYKASSRSITRKMPCNASIKVTYFTSRTFTQHIKVKKNIYI